MLHGVGGSAFKELAERNQSILSSLDGEESPESALKDWTGGQSCASLEEDDACALPGGQVEKADEEEEVAMRCRSRRGNNIWMSAVLILCAISYTAEAHRMGGFSAPPMLRKCGQSQLPAIGAAAGRHHVLVSSSAKCSMTNAVVSADNMGVEVVGNVTSGMGLRDAYAVRKRRGVGEHRGFNFNADARRGSTTSSRPKQQRSAPSQQKDSKTRSKTLSRVRARFQVVESHPSLRGMPAREVRWRLNDKFKAAKDEDLAGAEDGRKLAAGIKVYAVSDDGSLMFGQVVRCASVSEYDDAPVKAMVEIKPVMDESSPTPKSVWVPLSDVFPVGGHNGGDEAGLHLMVNEGSSTRDRGYRSVEGDDTLGSVLRAVQQGRKKRQSVLKTCTEEPIIEAVLEYIENARIRMMQEPSESHVLVFSSKSISDARTSYHRSVVLGQEKLNRFCELFAQKTFPGKRFARQNVVIGQTCAGEGSGSETFTLVEPIDAEELSWESLAARSLSRMLVLPSQTCYSSDQAGNCAVEIGDEESESDTPIPEAYRLSNNQGIDSGGGGANSQETILKEEGWRRPIEVTHYLAYEALTSRDIGIGGVYRFFGAQKSCAEVWDNVADRLCHVQGFLDLAARRGHSNNDYVDDVLTVKIVVDGEEEARGLLESLHELTFDAKLLRSVDVPFYPKGHHACTEGLDIVEIRDCFTERERSGWSALRVLVRWWNVNLNLVIEPLEVFHREMERVTPESYDEYKKRRAEVRTEIADKWPTYAFIRELLGWMFVRKDNALFVGEVPVSNPKVTVKFVTATE